MKKWIGVIVSFIIVILIVAITPVSIPRVQIYNQQFDGVLYQLGETNKDYLEPVQITFEGRLYTNILGGKRFKGFMDINDEDFMIPKDQRKLELKFEKQNTIWSAYIHYPYFSSEFVQIYGQIYMDDDFRKATITKYMMNSDVRGGSWGGDDGLMISAPAKNRDEALMITNELVGKYLNFYFK